MAVKIRLQRHGKKNFAFFHIVVADVRAKRDGRYIEQIGSYNPNTNPATINLDEQDVEGGCDLDYVPNKGVEGNIDAAMSATFGFGGHNGAIIIKKFKD